MRRGLSIVIYSLLLVPGWAQFTDPSGYPTDTFATGGIMAGYPDYPVPANNSGGAWTQADGYPPNPEGREVVWFWQVFWNGSQWMLGLNRKWSDTGAIIGFWGNWPLSSMPYTADETPSPTPTPTPTPSPTPGDETYDVSWYYEFGSEYAGMKLEILDVNTGSVLDSVVVGDGGAILAGDFTVFGPGVSMPNLQLVGYRQNSEGAWVEGGSAAILSSEGSYANPSVTSWQVQGDNAPAGTSYTGEGGVVYVSQGNGIWSASSPGPPGNVQQSVNIAQSFSGGMWYLVNQNGGLIDSGVVPEGGGSVTTNTGRMPGEIGTFFAQELIPGQEGSTLGPLQPIGSGTSIGQTGTLPSPASPNYSVVVTNQVTELVVTNMTTDLTITNNIEVNIPEREPGVPTYVADADEPDFELGEAPVVNTLTEIQNSFMQGMTNLQGAADNIGLTFDELRSLTLSPPGTTCTFEMGSYTINLGELGAVREGSKLLFLFFGIAAFVGILRDLFNG